MLCATFAEKRHENPDSTLVARQETDNQSRLCQESRHADLELANAQHAPVPIPVGNPQILPYGNAHMATAYCRSWLS
jgi:hypothetical protein